MLSIQTNIMKKIHKVLITGFCLLSPVFIACGNNDNDVNSPGSVSKEVAVTVTPASLNPDYNAQTIDLTVTSDADWAIRTEASWISLRPSGGVKNETVAVKITVEANKEMDSRTAVLNIISGNKTVKSVEVVQGYAMNAYASSNSMMFGGEAAEKELTITSNGDWTLTSDSQWLSANPSKGGAGDSLVKISVETNSGEDTREGTLQLVCGESVSTIKVSQLNYNVTAPEGYSLVWSDEFNYEGKPSSDWVIENQPAGWVNNELQTYTSREIDGKLTLEVKDGFLHINCFKGSDGKIYSGRMNAKPSTGWTHGYIEARINLPSGKGTWPAFWMMPSNVDWGSDPWPHCGEIDIMEEVGVNPNYVSSSLHTGKYNHTMNTQKTHEMYLPGAEGEFHTYAIEWTEDAITTYVDGKVQLTATRASMGSDHESWPFNRAFYPILNLAWGGDWGGWNGVNENALPITMMVDYVRIFQKQ